MDLVDLRRRIAETRWPERETIDDISQGVPLATMQELACYWATDYDGRKCEEKLNVSPCSPKRSGPHSDRFARLPCEGDTHMLVFHPAAHPGSPRHRLRRAEHAPDELLTALVEFPAPYRDGEIAPHETHERSAHT